MKIGLLLVILIFTSCQQSKTRQPNSLVEDIELIEIEPIDEGDDKPLNVNQGGEVTSSVSEDEVITTPAFKIHERPVNAMVATFSAEGEDNTCGDYKKVLKHNGIKKVGETEFDKLNREQILKAVYNNGKIVVHHSAGNKTDSASGIINYHIKPVSKGGRGWSDAGYHFIIEYNGEIFNARPLSKMGAHVDGAKEDKEKICKKSDSFPVAIDKDYRAIGICLLGNFDHYPPSSAQQESLAKLLKYLKEKYNIHEVQPHRHYKDKVCPGKYAEKMFDNMFEKPKQTKKDLASNTPYPGDKLKCKFCEEYKNKPESKSK